MGLPLFVATTALLLPGSLVPLRQARCSAVTMGATDSLREALQAVKSSAPLSSADFAEVRRLCDDIVSAAAPVGGPSSSPTNIGEWQSTRGSSRDIAKAEIGVALTKLFAHYDSKNDGVISLNQALAGTSVMGLGSVSTDWAARQQRAGARRMRQIFARAETTADGRVSQDDFVGMLTAEFDRRIERGLSTARAVAEIEANLPGEVAELYGSE